MTTDTAQHVQMDFNAAAQLAAEAAQVGGLIRNIEAIVESVLASAWKGPDAIGFRTRWERELEQLTKVRAELLACAQTLHDDASRRTQVLMRPVEAGGGSALL
jgi:hypothetical protein